MFTLCACSGAENTPSPAADGGATDAFIDGGSDATPEGGDAARAHPVLDQTCPVSSVADACDKCSQERCCETRTACDPECKAIFTCINTCTDGAAVCVNKCMDAHPTGAAGYSAQNACVNLYCTTPCGGKADPCRDCRLENCALEHVTCFADPECRRYGYCFEACTDAACDEGCRSKTTAAVVKRYDAYNACLNKRCGSVCF